MRIILKPAGFLVVLLTIGILLFAAFTKRGVSVPPAAPVAATPAPAPVASPLNLVQNGDMSAQSAEGFPANWGDRWFDGKGVAVTSDAVEPHSAPAALRLDTENGFVKAQSKQVIPAQSGSQYKVSGYIRSKGTGVWSLGVQFYNAAMKPVGFQHIGDTTPNAAWQQREDTVTVPPDATQMGVMLYAEGQGKGWLDDVSVTAVP